ncbi:MULTISPECIES: hypothetical protein [Nocardioides]|uniref:Apea-like HEPN domain-containing protein n=1 Tax=Nocardioides vastitatis TaxID=2568655 RepID=A0ABW0ZP46_9ACTN|nr:hypothetical protein [Nocardioides sp.]THI99036.1 hypothetical protein E7Z54_12960 [Nocardioides sp.]
MERHRSVVLIGSADISGIVEGLTHTSRLNSKSTLTFEIPSDAARDHLIDLTAQVTWSVVAPSSEIEGDRGDLRFAGRVEVAEERDGVIHVGCSSMAVRFENVRIPLLKNELTPQDAFVLMASLGGFPPDRVSSGDPEPEVTEFDVLLPLVGIRVGDALAANGLDLRGTDALTPFEQFLEPNPGLQAIASACHSVACARVRARWAVEAETQGRRLVEDALAWLMVGVSDGLVHTNGPKRYLLDDARSRPDLLGMVIVNSLSDRGRYLRSLETIPRAPIVTPGTERLSLDGLDPAGLPANLSDALASFQRAYLSVGSPAILALWECIEFVVINTEVPALFKGSQTRALRRASKGVGLTPSQQHRFDEALSYLNAPPLLLKLRRFAQAGEVPISDFEMALVAKLRRHRNDVMHGRRPEHVEPEDLRHGMSIVARILRSAVMRSARRYTAQN